MFSSTNANQLVLRDICNVTGMEVQRNLKNKNNNLAMSFEKKLF